MTDGIDAIIAAIIPLITITNIVVLALIYAGYRLLLALIDAGVKVSKNRNGDGNGNSESLFKRVGRRL